MMRMNERNFYIPFWFLFVGYFLIMMSPSFLSEGMFLDGIIYSEISSNMSEGKGSLWDPYMNQVFFSSFREHPPLAFGLNSIFYNIFGVHIIVDKIYSVFTLIIAALLIIAIWKRTTNSLKMSWFPLLLWSLLPLVTWSATNNVLENTMSIFVLLSVFIAIVGIQNDKKYFFVLSGISLFLAFLCKGFTGLFPLIFVIIYDYFYRERRLKQTIVSFLLVLLGLLGSYSILYLFSSGFSSYIATYFNNQVVGSIENVVTVSSRFFIVFYLLQLLLVPLILLLVISIIHKLTRKIYYVSNNRDKDFKWFLVFVFLGLSGVLPIMISLKQSGFYMLTALPFFALALAHLFKKTLESLLTILSDKVHKILSYVFATVLVLGVSLNILFAGKYGRDETFLKDMKVVIQEVGNNATISIASKDHEQYGWYSYFARYGDVGLDSKNYHEYLLLSSPEQLYELNLHTQYAPVDINTKSIFLYKRIND